MGEGSLEGLSFPTSKSSCGGEEMVEMGRGELSHQAMAPQRLPPISSSISNSREQLTLPGHDKEGECGRIYPWERKMSKVPYWGWGMFSADRLLYRAEGGLLAELRKLFLEGWALSDLVHRGPLPLLEIAPKLPKPSI